MQDIDVTGDQSRRSLIRRVCLVALGAIGLGGAAGRVDASVVRPARAYRVSAVDGVRDQQVSVPSAHGWLPVECVPPGWEPLIGDRVAVGPSSLVNRITAEQISRGMTIRAAPRDLQPGRSIGGPNGPVITEATALDPALSSLRSRRDIRPRRLHASVTDRWSPDDRVRVLSISVREA